MGIGNSTLGGKPPRAWWNEWPQTTSGNEQQRARLIDDFEGVEPEQEEPVPSVTVAETHAFLEQRAGQWRGPDPAGLPPRWPATAFQLWANLTQQVERVRLASTPAREIRSAPDGASADNAGDQHLASVLDGLTDTLLAGTVFHHSENIAQTAQPAQPAPNRHIGNAPSGTGDKPEAAQSAAPALNRSVAASAVENAGGLYLASELDKLMPSLLSDYLIAQGYAETGEPSACGQNATVLTALHRHLAPARAFVGDPAALDRLDADARANLMRHVARKRGFYGARDGEQSAAEFQRQLLIRLVSPWAMGCAQAGGTSTAAPGLPAVSTDETMTRIKEDGISRLQTAGLSADAAQWALGMLWADAEPTLVRADTPGALRYGSLEWADLQTGIDLAGAAGLDHWPMTYTELVALAQTVDMTVRQHPDAAAELLAPQVRAALTFAGIAPEADDPDCGKCIEQAMTLLNAARTERWEAAQHKLETLQALQAPMPTRSGIGARILREHDIDPEQHMMVRRTRLEVGGKYYAHPTRTRLAQYMGGDRSGSLYIGGEEDKSILPDLDPLFDQAFTEYAAGHRRAVTVLFDYAVQALPEQDCTFWQRGKAQILVPQVRAGRYLPGKPFSPLEAVAPRPFSENSSPQAKPFTAIVAITHGGQTRHYLAAVASAEGQLIRFFARDLPHDGEASPGNANILDDVLLPCIDDLVTQGSAVKAAEVRRWKLLSGGASGRAVPVLAQYFFEAVGKLRDQAYQSTREQQFEQAVRDGLMSMIPFYDCANEVKDGNTGGAIFSCALDIVSLAPVVGPALKTGVAIGKLAVRFNISALRQLASAAATGSFRQVLSKVAGAQAKLVGSAGRTLGWEAVQAFDPGVQLFYGASKVFRSVGKGLRSTGKGLQALLSTLRAQPALQTLTNRVAGLLKRKPFYFDARAGVWQIDADAVTWQDGRRVAQVGAREVEVIDLGDVARVPVVRAADHADARFILAEPLQGRPYGPQWAPTADGFAALGDYRVRLASPVPDPVAGIIHVGPCDYIQVNGEYYPVRQDKASQTWRIQRENDPDGAAIPVRYDAGHGRWEVPGDDAAGSAAVVRRPSLDDLPGEMQSGIASHLADGDTGRLSQASRYWEGFLVQERRAGQLAEEARSVGRLGQMLVLLDRAEGIGDLRMSLRARPLVALTQRLGAMPALDRLAAFHYLYEAIGALPSAQRGLPLAALAERLGDLTAVDRLGEYRRIFEATLKLEARHRGEPLAALAGGIGHLADNQGLRWMEFDNLVRETLMLDARHRALPLAGLATAVPYFSESNRLNRFDLVFAEVGTLPLGQRAGPLASLSEQIGVLHGGDRQSAFDRMLEGIDLLHGPHRAEPLASLSGQIGVLHRIDGQPAFNRMLERIDALPAQQRAVALDALANQVPMLPGDGWLQPFDGVVRAAVWLDAGGHGEQLALVAGRILRLPPERRLAAVRSLLHAVETLDPERRAGQYTQLARRIFELPQQQRLDGFDAVFGATIQLPAERRAVPLAELTDNFLWMPDHRQPDEFNRILGQINEIPAQHRDLLLEALTKQVRRLPSEFRPDAFEGLVSASVALDAGVKGEPLMRLARIVGELPEDRQTAAFDRLIRATAALDADVRSEQLMRLARLGERLPADRLAAFRSLLRAVETLDVGQRGEQYVQFAWLIDPLPYHQRRALFDAVFTATLALPAQHRVVPLEALTAGIHLLPENWRLDAIRRVGSEINKLSAQTWNAALRALVEQFDSLPERRWGLFATLTHAAALTTPDNRAALLRMLIQRIRQVEPPADRGRAWHSALRETERLAPQPRAMAHVAQADQLESIMPDDRLDAFNSLLDAIRALPPQHRGAPLMAAADNIHLLPKAAEPAASNRIRDIRNADRAG